MAGSVEVLKCKLSQIETANDQLPLLQELKTLVYTTDFKNKAAEIKKLRLAVIFDCLNTSNNEQIQVSCDILSHLVPYLDDDKLFSNYGNEITRGLNHPNPHVKEAVLKQLSRIAENESVVHEITNDNERLNGIEDSLSSEDVGTSQAVTKLFVNMCHTKTGRGTFFSQPMSELLTRVMNKGEMCRIRVFELLINTSISSEECLQQWNKTDIPFKMVDDLYGEDVVSVLNLVELYSQLCVTTHGLSYCEESGVIGKLEQLLESKSADDFASLYIPGFLKFYGSVGQVFPTEMIEKYPLFCTFTLRIIADSDVSLSLAGLDTFAQIGESVAGKKALVKLDPNLSECLHHMGDLIGGSNNELRMSCLYTIASVMTVDPHSRTSDVMSITKEWFSLLSSDNSLNLIMSIATQPFPELRKYGLKVLNSIAGQQWGMELMQQHPGMVEYLTHRNIEPDIECKKAKFNVVLQLVEADNNGIATSFDVEAMDKFKDFVKRGSLATDLEPVVAVEDAM